MKRLDLTSSLLGTREFTARYAQRLAGWQPGSWARNGLGACGRLLSKSRHHARFWGRRRNGLSGSIVPCAFIATSSAGNADLTQRASVRRKAASFKSAYVNRSQKLLQTLRPASEISRSSPIRALWKLPSVRRSNAGPIRIPYSPFRGFAGPSVFANLLKISL